MAFYTRGRLYMYGLMRTQYQNTNYIDVAHATLWTLAPHGLALSRYACVEWGAAHPLRNAELQAALCTVAICSCISGRLILDNDIGARRSPLALLGPARAGSCDFVCRCMSCRE